jgi:hypothetical protein
MFWGTIVVLLLFFSLLDDAYIRQGIVLAVATWCGVVDGWAAGSWLAGWEVFLWWMLGLTILFSPLMLGSIIVGAAVGSKYGGGNR